MEQIKCGTVLQYDGWDVVDIRHGIHSLLRGYGGYKGKTVEQKLAVTWESQKDAIANVVGSTVEER